MKLQAISFARLRVLWEHRRSLLLMLVVVVPAVLFAQQPSGDPLVDLKRLSRGTKRWPFSFHHIRYQHHTRPASLFGPYSRSTAGRVLNKRANRLAEWSQGRA